MLFNTGHFFAFLAVVLALHYASPVPWRRWILLAASYYFYMCWNAKFVTLLLALTAIDYVAGRWIAQSEGTRRKLALSVSICANLGFLGFFKYYNFLAGALCMALGKPEDSFVLSIVLPVGISFHTFQSMSYVIDVYRRQMEPVRSPVDYALFIAFFPQLVAGPIVRAGEFFQDYYNWRKPKAEEVQRGVLMIAFGLMKKMALADQFAILSNDFFANPAAMPGYLAAWTGAMSFAFQVYFDFSGYTGIAIGSAKLLGYHFPENFRRPFLSSSTTELWRRWHMSLSRWLRDYLYISLGGNRKGPARTYVNLMLTMLLGGLWHGAGWN
jgi:D-alanyl-lipoteichoic acid acyltransferase DltB (MBOAT superfamily)